MPNAIIEAHFWAIVAVLHLAQSWPSIIGYTVDDPHNHDTCGRLYDGEIEMAMVSLVPFFGT